MFLFSYPVFKSQNARKDLKQKIYGQLNVLRFLMLELYTYVKII